MFNQRIKFPAQKKATSQKGKPFMKECVDAGEGLILYISDSIRKSIRNKRINYNLYSDILDQDDIENTCNPHRIKGLKAPAKMQNYPICNPKIDLLVGESIKRRFDWKVRVLNDDAISKKEEQLKEAFAKLMQRHITEDMNDEQKAKELKDFNRFRTYEYQDLRERMATHVLKHLYHKERLDYKFSKGFKDALICAEEIYQIDVVAGEPVVERLNPMNVYTIRSSNSPFIEDSDIIVIVGYHSPGKIIDTYHDELTSAEISEIEDGIIGESARTGNGIHIGYKPDLPMMFEGNLASVIAEHDNFDYGSPYDTDGNIRVTKVYWKSMRKMLVVTAFDENGNEYEELYDENYKVDTSKGETAKEMWISEWMEGHKIGGGLGNDSGGIYKKLRVRPVQYRSMENPSKCLPGIVGTIYNTNDNEGVSLMDRMKPYQYLYNILAYNTELMIAKNKGKIQRLDLASIPEHWDIQKWLSFAESMNIAVYDSFKEGNKGASMGKMLGAQPHNPTLDMEVGNSIQMYMNMMAYIKNEMGEIAGVSGARQGQISNREAVNNVEREVSQTSHITEYWFAEHDLVKIRVMEALLETAKYAWKNKKNKKVQYVLDDGSTEIFSLDGEQFNEIDYDLAITNGGNSAELMSSLKTLAQAALQNQIINFSQLMDIYSTDSISSIRRKIQNAEEEKMEQMQKEAEMKQKMQTEQLNANALEAEKERAFKREEWDRQDARNTENNETKIVAAQITASKNTNTDYDNDGVADQISLQKLQLDAKKMDMDAKKAANEARLKQSVLDETERHNKVTEQQKDRDLTIKSKKPSGPKK